MKWRGGRRSTNIEDRRGSRAPTGRGVKMGGGIGGMGIILLIIVFLTGGDPMQLLGDMLGGGGAVQQSQQAPTRSQPGNDEASEFVRVILGDTEDTWRSIFASRGARYRDPVLVLYNDMVQSACGMNSAASGPFYCPGDYKVYLELGFFKQLERMGAPGDFAQAYVIAHEVAHHVQNLQGISMEVQRLQRQVSKTQANQLSVLTELQADCLAGVWAHHAARQRNLLERGDIEEGLRAAASIGDDHLQRQAGRAVRPESFTHGSSEQRMDWFKRGLTSGDMDQCDTFAAARRS
ncbi:MAG: neutral zinc metallopeptidase [Pseudomonadota bacterium]